MYKAGLSFSFEAAIADEESAITSINSYKIDNVISSFPL